MTASRPQLDSPLRPGSISEPAVVAKKARWVFLGKSCLPSDPQARVQGDCVRGHRVGRRDYR